MASPAVPLTTPITFGIDLAEAIDSLASSSPPPSTPTPHVEPDPVAVLGQDPVAPISFAPLQLDSSPVLQPLRRTTPAPAPAVQAPAPDSAPGAAPAPAPAAAAPAPAAPEPVATPAVPAPVADGAGTPDHAPLAAAGSIAASLVAADAETPSVELPRIVEATPVPETSEVASYVDVGPAPVNPHLPKVQAAVQAPHATHDVYVAPAPVETSRSARKRSRRGASLFLTLVVLSAVVAAAVVFGRPYLFPGDWDAETQPYAEAVEAARGVEFVEPISLISEPTAPYGELLMTELVGDWTDQEPAWRALGLLTGTASFESVAQQTVGWQAAVYSVTDGQVYRDAGASGVELDADITAALADAALDQQYRWSRGERSLEGDVLTSAEVQRQSAAVVADSPYAIVTSVDPTALAFVPPVVAYRLLAPAVYAEFDNPNGSLSDVGPTGPGPLTPDVPVVAPGPTMNGSDTLVSSPEAMDRSFWYLVLGGFLEPRAAYDASEAIVENSLSLASRGGQQCVYATFAGGDVAQTATLRSALEAWSAAAPAEFGAAFAVLPDGTLQLVTCDPGAGSEVANRQGLARELIAWRTAELATIEAVTANDGTEADIDAAWAIVRASDMAPGLARLPAGTSPDDTADAARAALTELFTPVGE